MLMLVKRGLTGALTLGVLVLSLGACQQLDNLSISLTTEDNSSAEQYEGTLPKPELNFSILDGKIYNHFYRQDKVAAHTLLTSGKQPRLVVAFPAGNSGVSLWFERLKQGEIHWQEISQIAGIKQLNDSNESLYGIEARLVATGPSLTVSQAVLSNVRVIRDYLHTRLLPNEIKNKVDISGNTVTWYRSRLDGKAGYRLSLKAIKGQVDVTDNGSVTFNSDGQGQLELELKALTGDKPLTPIIKGQLLTHAPNDTLSEKILAFLSYEEKLLAGSWRFATYFGRDTLMSTKLLMPALRPDFIEAALGSVLTRVNSNGSVAHEEDIGEFAVLRHLRESGTAKPQAFYDYKMVDDDFMLAPIMADYLLNHLQTKAKMKNFLSQTVMEGESYGQKLKQNLERVIEQSKAYAENPVFNNLIKIHSGHTVGDWRDSGEGLGFGKYPYNVNAIFVPAALEGIIRLAKSGLVDNRYLPDIALTDLHRIEQVWKQSAPEHFVVTVDGEEANRLVQRYADANQLPISSTLKDRLAEPIQFNAVSVDETGEAVKILNSDDGFAMLFLKPSEQQLSTMLEAALRPYPAGLLSPVGLLVANPVYAEPDLQSHFTNNHYHGEVVWSWQQALFAAGIAKQLERKDLSQQIRIKLLQGQTDLWAVINSVKQANTAELWSWSIKNGQYQVESFGQRSGDKTESNAAQLWSTVYLAITDPASKLARIKVANKTNN